MSVESTRPALLLLGHGSSVEAETGLCVRRLGAQLREHPGFAEVRVGLWKEEPAIRDALSTVATKDVVVVPVLAAEGYFWSRIFPRELGIETVAAWQRSADGRRLAYAHPVGARPEMRRLVECRIAQGLESAALEPAALQPAAPGRRRSDSPSRHSAAGRLRPEEASIVLLGHGTPRHAKSAETVRAIAAQVRSTGRFAEVTAAFLDQDPTIGALHETLTGRHWIVVPVFVADGMHTRTDLPNALGIDPLPPVAGPTAGATGDESSHPVTARSSLPGEPVVTFTAAAGSAGLEELVLACAKEALAAANAASTSTATLQDPGPAFVVNARRALLRELGGGRLSHIGPLTLRAAEGGFIARVDTPVQRTGDEPRAPDQGFRELGSRELGFRELGFREQAGHQPAAPEFDSLPECWAFDADGRYRKKIWADDAPRLSLFISCERDLFDALDMLVPAWTIRRS